MGRDRKPMSKAKEKKLAAKQEAERKRAERAALVAAANGAADPLAALPSFKKFNKNGLDVTLETRRVADLEDHVREWVMDLLKANMKEAYEKSRVGWNEKNMAEEMLDDPAWYLVAREADGSPVAFSHFRYEMEHEEEVLYVYEIQLEEKVRRKGLGRFMMMVLELLSNKADMRKIMLTCFKHNQGALEFFKKALKYEWDEGIYEEDIKGKADSEILSKPNKKKLAREAEAEEAAARAKGKPAGAAGCCPDPLMMRAMAGAGG